MVYNPDKCHFVGLSDPNYTTLHIMAQQVLGVTTDVKLNFVPYFGNIIKKENQKLHALSRVKRYMGFEQNN